MLRITRIVADGLVPAFRLEGKLLAPWVEEVRRACASPDGGLPCRLDLSALSFVDEAGVALLREMRRAGVLLGPCSSYIIELLRLEAP